MQRLRQREVQKVSQISFPGIFAEYVTYFRNLFCSFLVKDVMQRTAHGSIHPPRERGRMQWGCRNMNQSMDGPRSPLLSSLDRSFVRSAYLSHSKRGGERERETKTATTPDPLRYASPLPPPRLRLLLSFLIILTRCPSTNDQTQSRGRTKGRVKEQSEGRGGTLLSSVRSQVIGYTNGYDTIFSTVPNIWRLGSLRPRLGTHFNPARERHIHIQQHSVSRGCFLHASGTQSGLIVG